MLTSAVAEQNRSADPWASWIDGKGWSLAVEPVGAEIASAVAAVA